MQNMGVNKKNAFYQGDALLYEKINTSHINTFTPQNTVFEQFRSMFISLLGSLHGLIPFAIL